MDTICISEKLFYEVFCLPILALSDEERVLFREVIKVCDKKINPGLLKIKWNTDVSELYISDCFSCVSEVRIKLIILKSHDSLLIIVVLFIDAT
jgi:hypothetical protein